MDEDTTHEKSAAAMLTARASLSTSGTIERGLNDIRLAVLGILVTVGLAAAAIPDRWWVQLLAGSGSFALACFLVWYDRTRHYLMEFVHCLTGQ